MSLDVKGEKIEYDERNDTYIIRVNDDSVKVRNPTTRQVEDIYSSYFKFVKPVLPPGHASYSHTLPHSKTDKNCNDITYGHSTHAVYGPYDSNLQILPEGTKAVSIPNYCYSKYGRKKILPKYDEIEIKGYDSSTHEYTCSVEGGEDVIKIPITKIRLKCGSKECEGEWPFINIEKIHYKKEMYLHGITPKTNNDSTIAEGSTNPDETPSSDQVEGIDELPPPTYDESKNHESLGGSRKRKSKKHRKSKRKSNRRRKSRGRRL
jgi:hypothetical protein